MGAATAIRRNESLESTSFDTYASKAKTSEPPKRIYLDPFAVELFAKESKIKSALELEFEYAQYRTEIALSKDKSDREQRVRFIEQILGQVNSLRKVKGINTSPLIFENSVRKLTGKTSKEFRKEIDSIIEGERIATSDVYDKAEYFRTTLGHSFRGIAHGRENFRPFIKYLEDESRLLTNKYDKDSVNKKGVIYNTLSHIHSIDEQMKTSEKDLIESSNKLGKLLQEAKKQGLTQNLFRKKFEQEFGKSLERFGRDVEIARSSAERFRFDSQKARDEVSKRSVEIVDNSIIEFAALFAAGVRGVRSIGGVFSNLSNTTLRAGGVSAARLATQSGQSNPIMMAAAAVGLIATVVGGAYGYRAMLAFIDYIQASRPTTYGGSLSKMISYVKEEGNKANTVADNNYKQIVGGAAKEATGEINAAKMEFYNAILVAIGKDQSKLTLFSTNIRRSLGQIKEVIAILYDLAVLEKNQELLKSEADHQFEIVQVPKPRDTSSVEGILSEYEQMLKSSPSGLPPNFQLRTLSAVDAANANNIDKDLDKKANDLMKELVTFSDDSNEVLSVIGYRRVQIEKDRDRNKIRTELNDKAVALKARRDRIVKEIGKDLFAPINAMFAQPPMVGSINKSHPIVGSSGGLTFAGAPMAFLLTSNLTIDPAGKTREEELETLLMEQIIKNMNDPDGIVQNHMKVIIAFITESRKTEAINDAAAIRANRTQVVAFIKGQKAKAENFLSSIDQNTFMSGIISPTFQPFKRSSDYAAKARAAEKELEELENNKGVLSKLLYENRAVNLRYNIEELEGAADIEKKAGRLFMQVMPQVFANSSN
jgi:hypothetical protein